MKWPLFLVFASLGGAASVASARDGDQLQQADLAKLAAPVLRRNEVARLVKCDGKKKLLTAWRLHPCPQHDGKGDLQILAAACDYDFQIGGFSSRGSYRIDAPQELFGEATGANGLLKPSLALVSDHVILVIDPEGKELRPFGGDNYITRGHLFDFNSDGILDRADRSSHSVKGADDHDIDIFELATVEREPRQLLKVIFNWHHEDANESNEWGFTCYDEENDGRVEIAFGPKNASTDADQRRFVFRWDEEAKRYTAGEIPEHSHIRVVRPDETLEQIAKAGGLGYRVEGGSSGDPFAKRSPYPVAPQKPYTFSSLKGAGDAELLAFFRGQQRRDPLFDGPPDAVETRVPPGFWDMSPKQAALAFAEANRTPTHRRSWKLVIDDRGGITLPKSGWWLHDWNSSGCYSFSKHIFALRFGVESPVLLATDYNSQGVVGRNPLADQPGSTARLIPLSAKEAQFLADTLFWLDRIRSHTSDKPDGMSGYGSSADGFGTLHVLADGAPPREVASDTVWAGRSISSRWNEDYTPGICVNLVEHLLASALPAHLGERWRVAPEIDRRSLMTPLDQRLTPRHDTPARDQLVEVMGHTFERHFEEPIPAPALAELVACVGQEAFQELKPALERLKVSLPKSGAEDEEFEALQNRFDRDHFGTPKRDDPSDHPKEYERYLALRTKRELDPGPVLRKPLDQALDQLGLAASSKLLLKEIRANGDQTRWALDRLRRNFPAIWKDHLIGEFQHANLEERKNLFETLAVASPQAARDLLALISPREIDEIVIEVAEFQVEHDPDIAPVRVPALIRIVRQPTTDSTRRGQAINLLGRIKLKPEEAAALTPLLLAELKNPQKKNDFGSSYAFCEAIGTLSRLPGAKEHLDEIGRATEAGYNGFSAGIDALLRLTEGAADRQSRLEAFVRPRLKQHTGMMNDVFQVALTLDLRGLAVDIAAMASESPSVQDGNGADYGGGSFKGPAGERYHIAREITALWNEEDPATRARMWIAMAVSRPSAYDFSGETELEKRLRERAEEAIRELPQEPRGRLIEAMIAANPVLGHYPGTTEWLQGVATK